MTTRRRTRTKLPPAPIDDDTENVVDNDATFDIKPSTSKRTQSRSRKSKMSEEADIDQETKSRTSNSSAIPSYERVTRSRSRSVLKDDVVKVAPISRLPRLDVQSEDEEEEVEPEEIVENTPDKSWTNMLPPNLLTKETKSIAIASLILLILLVIVNRVTETLNNDKHTNEAVIMVLAYILTPVRLTVESFRLLSAFILGSGQVSTGKVLPEVDYDLLVNNILNSDKFKLMVEHISSEKVTKYESKVEEKIISELEGKHNLRLQTELTNIDNQISTIRLNFKTEIDDAINKLKDDLATNVQHEANQKLVLQELETKINELKQQIDNLPSKDTNNVDDNENIEREVNLLRDKVEMLEEGRKATEAEITKCCKDVNTIDLVIENKVSGLLSQLKQNLENTLVTEEELNLRLKQVDDDSRDKLASYTNKVVEETKSDIEHLVNKKISELKKNLIDDHYNMMPENEVNTNNQSSIDVKKIVRDALTKYDADKTGLFDFALETAGGSILSTKCTEPYQMTSAVMSVWGIPVWWDSNSPRTILQPGTSPGQCWAFAGGHGVVVIQLSASIHITAVTVEHISSLLSPDGNIYSAPSQMSLFGVRDSSEPETVTPLLNFTYSAIGDPVQTFRLSEADTAEKWRVVELTIHNNHGHPDYTCLYRVRVHGNVSQASDDKKH